MFIMKKMNLEKKVRTEQERDRLLAAGYKMLTDTSDRKTQKPEKNEDSEKEEQPEEMEQPAVKEEKKGTKKQV